ncbi:hypothetical protein TthSNM17_07070 [Thermus thermophilus]|nr:hypothetical protein TthSNM17_07070 [Thermus thermophilus]
MGVEEVGLDLPDEGHHLKEAEKVLYRAHRLHEVSKEVDPHPQGAGFLHQEAVLVLSHPQVELRPVSEASEEFQEVDLGSPGFSAGDKVEEAHTFHIE